MVIDVTSYYLAWMIRKALNRQVIATILDQLNLDSNKVKHAEVKF